MKRLEHEADVFAADRGAAIFVEFGQIDARNQDLPLGGRVETGEQREQGRFSRTRGAHDRDGLAGSHRQAHIGENGQRPLGARDDLREIARFQGEPVLNFFGLDYGICHRERL